MFATRLQTPKATLYLPVVVAVIAYAPTAVFAFATVVAYVALRNAPNPTAVLKLPVVLALKLFMPTAVLALPPVLVTRDLLPTAVLHNPVVLLHSANEPTAVLAVLLVVTPELNLNAA